MFDEEKFAECESVLLGVRKLWPKFQPVFVSYFIQFCMMERVNAEFSVEEPHFVKLQSLEKQMIAAGLRDVLPCEFGVT